MGAVTRRAGRVVGTLLALAAAPAVAAAQGLAPEVVAADAVVATPEGVITVQGDLVRLLDGTGPSSRTVASLRLPARARVIWRAGSTVVLDSADPAAPLYPDMYRVVNPDAEGTEPADRVMVVARDGALHEVRRRFFDWDYLTCDGLRVARQAVGPPGGWALDDLLTGAFVDAAQVLVTHEDGTEGPPRFVQVPQPAGPGRTLLPVHDVLLLEDRETGLVWRADDRTPMISGLCASPDRSLVLVGRQDGSLEVRRIADGSLLWMRVGGRELGAALLEAELIGQEAYLAMPADPEPAGFSEVNTVTPVPDGWLVWWSDAGTAPASWLEHVACGGAGCRARILHPSVLRTDAAIEAVVTGSGSYALDENQGLLVRDATGWRRATP